MRTGVQRFKGNKLNNIKVVDADGKKFDSRKEYTRWLILRNMEEKGRIRNLRRQVKYVLIPSQKIDGKVVERECSYYADFVYELDGETVVEDTKGYKKGSTYNIFVIKRKMMLKEYGLKIREV